MTSYHVLISDELIDEMARHGGEPELRALHEPDGFRFIRPTAPGTDGHTRWWLCEDDNAPPELEQHRVEPVFMQIHGKVVLTERHIVNAHGVRVGSS